MVKGKSGLNKNGNKKGDVMGGRGGNIGLSGGGRKLHTLQGSEKQVKYANDILQSVYDEIDRSAKERMEKFGNNEKFLARIGQSEKEFKKTVNEAAKLFKTYYETKAYTYYGGNAGDIIENRGISFGKSDIKDMFRYVENDVRSGGKKDTSGIKLEMEKILKRGQRYKR